MLNQESRKSSLTMKSMKLGTKESRFTTEVTEDTEEKPGNGCPLITRMNTNEYFAVNLILHHKIKLTASVSALLVPISAIRG